MTENNISDGILTYWTWTGRVTKTRSRKIVFIPAEAVRQVCIDLGTLLHIEIRKEIKEGEEVWIWTSSPISRSSNLVIEIPIEAAATMEIIEGDYLHIRIQKR